MISMLQLKKGQPYKLYNTDQCKRTEYLPDHEWPEANQHEDEGHVIQEIPVCTWD